MDFGKILKRGQRKFQTRDQRGEWGLCEYCEERRKLYSYKDNKHELWKLCDYCIDLFVKEEE